MQFHKQTNLTGNAKIPMTNINNSIVFKEGHAFLLSSYLSPSFLNPSAFTEMNVYHICLPLCLFSLCVVELQTAFACRPERGEWSKKDDIQNTRPLSINSIRQTRRSRHFWWSHRGRRTSKWRSLSFNSVDIWIYIFFNFIFYTPTQL